MEEQITNFNWLLSDIDETLIFMLMDGKGMLGSYKASGFVVNGNNIVTIRFANIMDLTNFVDYGMVRFVNTLNKENIIDIPLKKLNHLYKASSEVIDRVPRGVELPELNTFSVYNGKVVTDGYAIYGYKIGEPSEDLKQILTITNGYDKLNMNEKIEALEDINLISYERSSIHSKKSGR